MNAHDKTLGGEDRDIATVRYGDGDFTVVKPGRYVICAVLGKRIALDALRYWNPELQEAYAGATEALTRWKQLND